MHAADDQVEAGGHAPAQLRHGPEQPGLCEARGEHGGVRAPRVSGMQVLLWGSGFRLERERAWACVGSVCGIRVRVPIEICTEG